MLTMQGGDSLVGGLPIIHITYQQYIANPSAYNDPDVIVHISGFPTAGNMPADYVGYDSNLNMEDIGNIATKAIAKIEPSDTALYLHEVGTGFINKDGNYCITDVQIAVGGTIVLGTNCHVVDGGISSKLVRETITVTAPAGTTYKNGFNLLFSHADFDYSKLTGNSYIYFGQYSYFHCIVRDPNMVRFSQVLISSAAIYLQDLYYISSNSHFLTLAGTVYSDKSNEVMSQNNSVPITLVF